MTLGELVKKWREDSGLSQPDLARRIGGSVKYQNIQQLEGGQAKQPRYLDGLARAMGCTVDDLLALRIPPPLSGDAQETAPPMSSTASPPAWPLSDIAPDQWAAMTPQQRAVIDFAATRALRELQQVYGPPMQAPPAPAPPALKVASNRLEAPDGPVAGTVDIDAQVRASRTGKKDERNKN